MRRSAEDSPQRTKRKNDMAEVEIHRYWEVRDLLGKFFAIRVFKPLLEVREGTKRKQGSQSRKYIKGLTCREKKQEELSLCFRSWGFKTSS